jgi:hypothetical protein
VIPLVHFSQKADLMGIGWWPSKIPLVWAIR